MGEAIEGGSAAGNADSKIGKGEQGKTVSAKV